MEDIVKWYVYVFFIGMGTGLFIGIVTALILWLFNFTKRNIL